MQDAAPGHEQDDERVHPVTLAVQVAALQAPRPDEQAAERHGQGRHEADRIVRADHRLAEVLVEAEIEDLIRQVQGGAERVEQERRDDEAGRDRGGQ